MAARIDTTAWTRPAIFDVLQREGGIPDDEMFRVFNMGLGMVAVCPQVNADAFRRLIPEAIIVGQVIRRDSDEQVHLIP